MPMDRAIKRARIAEIVLHEKSRPCKDCAGCFVPGDMFLYHRPHEVKKFNPSPSCGRTLTAVMKEILKCDVVCTRCARKRYSLQHPDRIGIPTFRPGPIRDPETVTQMLRRESKKNDARERRRRVKGAVGHDIATGAAFRDQPLPVVRDVPWSEVEDLDDSDT